MRTNSPIMNGPHPNIAEKSRGMPPGCIAAKVRRGNQGAARDGSVRFTPAG